MTADTSLGKDASHAAAADARRKTGAVLAWVLYHWAYDAFAVIVGTFVFATYFTQAVAMDPVRGTAQWSAMQAASGLFVALLAVPLGLVADRGGRRRVMLAVATLVLVVATAALWWVRPRSGQVPGDVGSALLLVATATVAFEVATVFYNAMLPGLAKPGKLGKLSMRAWGAGYAGGLVSLALCLLLLVLPTTPPFGLDPARAEPVRACALVAAIWMAVFGWPILVFGPPDGAARPWGQAVREGFADLRPVLAAACADRAIRRFLLSRLFFMDGLTTLFAFGGIYAAGQFGLTPTSVLLFGIGLTVTAGIGVAVFALIEDRIGSCSTIMTCLLGLTLLGTALLFVHDRAAFWVLGLSLGVFVGPAQAASRTLMCHLAPPGQAAGFFGLLALSGRVTAFAGPLALSAVTAITGSQRAGMGVIVAFLAVGAVLLVGVRRAGAVSVRPAPAPNASAPVANSGHRPGLAAKTLLPRNS